MADLRARRRTRDRRAAGISKKVQHADGTIRIFDFFARKIPVDGLLGEKPRRLEVHKMCIRDRHTGENSMVHDTVTENEIADIVGKWTGIPVSRLMEGEREKLLRLDERCV